MNVTGGIDLSGRVALVTGGARGIGRAVALALGRAGAAVAVNYRMSRAQAEDVVREIHRAGVSAVAIGADVSRPDEALRLLDEAESALGPIHILVNNAGVVEPAPFLEMDLTNWDMAHATNLRAPFVLGQAAARRMVHRHVDGRIIHITSRAAYQPFGMLAAYCAAKAGLSMLTRQMALELAPYGITVNEVVPGPTDTDMQRQHFSTSSARRTLGRPEDVAAAVLFLVSDDARHITGANLAVDGGSGLGYRVTAR